MACGLSARSRKRTRRRLPVKGVETTGVSRRPQQEARQAVAGCRDVGILERALSAAERAVRPMPRTPDCGHELTEREYRIVVKAGSATPLPRCSRT